MVKQCAKYQNSKAAFISLTEDTYQNNVPK